MKKSNRIPVAFLSVPVPAVSHPVLRKFMKKWKSCVGDIDGVTVEMQKDVPHIGVIKTGCQGLV